MKALILNIEYDFKKIGLSILRPKGGLTVVL